jgi:hypothetical protein
MSDAPPITADLITPKVRTGTPKDCPSQPKNRTSHTKVRCSTTKERLSLTIDIPCLTKLHRSHSNPDTLRTKDSNGQTNYIDNFLSKIVHSNVILPIIHLLTISDFGHILTKLPDFSNAYFQFVILVIRSAPLIVPKLCLQFDGNILELLIQTLADTDSISASLLLPEIILILKNTSLLNNRDKMQHLIYTSQPMGHIL